VTASADDRAGRREEDRDEERVQQRASELLPEEVAAGSDAPLAQAEAILAESDDRTDDPAGTRRESTQTMDDKRMGRSTAG
jgi:hypothetical protein